MATVGSLVADFRLDTSKFMSDFKRIDQNFQKMQRRVMNVRSAIAALGVGLAFRAIVRASAEQEAAFAQLEAAVRSTGGAAGFTAEELAGMATELQRVTAFGDESIMRMQGVLLTFTNIGRDIFPMVSEQALNVATRMGTDLKSSALQLGKALNDPIRGLDGLQRAGIQFNDSQKEVIRTLAETGRMADAQRMVLDELESQFGGSARAARNTFGGAIEGLKNTFGDLMEADNLGGAAAKINELTDALNDPAIQQGAAATTGAIINLGGSMAWVTTKASEFLQGMGILAAQVQLGGRPGGILDPQGMFETPGLGPSGTINRGSGPGSGGGVSPGSGRRDDAVDHEALQKLLEMSEAAEDAVATFGMADEELIRYRLTVGDLAETVRAAGVDGEFLADTIIDQTRAYRELEEETNRNEQAAQAARLADEQRQRSIEDIISDLERQAETLGMSTTELTLYRLETLGAEQAQIQLASALASSIEEFEAQQRELERNKRLAEEFGFAFSSAFEDAIIKGGSLREVLAGIAEDIARIALRESITRPLGTAISGAVRGLFGFASGGSFKVGGSGGTDSQLVAFKATPDETVHVTRPGQSPGGGPSVTFNQHMVFHAGFNPTDALPLLDRMEVRIKDLVEHRLQWGDYD